MDSPTASGVFPTAFNGPVVNVAPPVPSLANACCAAPMMGHVFLGTIGGQSARCAECGGGITTQWMGGPTTLQERSYCAWCDDPRTKALKAKLGP